MVKSRVDFRIECRAYFTVIDMFIVVFVFPPYQYSWISCIWFPVTSSNSVASVTGVKSQEKYKKYHLKHWILNIQKKYHIPDFENCKKPYTPKNLAGPKINTLNVHGMCWSNLGPTSFSGPSRGREKALVWLAFKTTNCGF